MDSDMDPRMGTSFDLGSGTTGAFAVNTPAYLESRYRWLVAYQQDILKVSKEPTENASFAEVKADCLTDAQLVLQQHASGEMAEREALMSTVYGVSAKDVFMLFCCNNFNIIDVIDMYANMHRKVLSEGDEESSMVLEDLTAAFKDLIKVAMQDPTKRPTDEDVDRELEKNYLEFFYVVLESGL